MKASELIVQLRARMEAEGDLDVMYSDRSGDLETVDHVEVVNGVSLKFLPLNYKQLERQKFFELY